MRKVLPLSAWVVVAFAIQAAAQCPTIKVVGPAGITNPGDNVVFQAEINVVGPKLSYSWSVDKGTIIEGQGTVKIAVATDRSIAGQTIIATVKLNGMPSGCVEIASETAGIDNPPACCHASDEWDDKMKSSDQRGRMDVFFSELANSPTNIGVIVLGVKPDDKLDPRNSRIKFVLKHIKLREFDKGRFLFFLEPSEERSTRLYRIPPGGNRPPCEGCLVFKGEHL